MRTEGMRDDLKVAIVSSGLGHVYRGVEGWSADLARALSESGAAVTLFKGGGTKKEAYERVVPCIRRGSALARFLVRWLPCFSWRFGFGTDVQIEGTTFALMLLGTLMRERYDIIHTKELPVAAVLQLARRCGLIHPKIIFANGTNETADSLKNFKYVQQLAPHYLQAARAEAGGSAAQWFWIPNFLDTDAFRPGIPSTVRAELGIPAEATVVLCVAAIKKEHKRIDYFIEEMATLLQKRKEGVYTVIAGGETPGTAELMRLGKEKLGEKVRFIIDRPRVRMPELYAAADIFALCSLREMFGTVLLEAMATGVAVLAHRHPVLEWVVGPGGECLDMSEKGTLSSALGKYFDRRRRTQAGKAGREHVLRNFSKPVVTAQFIRRYRAMQRSTGTEGTDERACQCYYSGQ